MSNQEQQSVKAISVSGEPLLKATELNYAYANSLGVQQINLELFRGEVLGMLGPNGAGKSTTLKLLAGHLRAESGIIELQGQAFDPSCYELRGRIGYLPEHPPLYQSLKVDEYLEYCARLHGIKANAIRERVDTVKQQCGLEHCGKRLIRALSKGYRQRVGIAQAIVHEPDIVLLDEPTDGLDPIQIIEMRKLIKTLAQRHAVILSTHIMQEIDYTCARVMILNRGKVAFDGRIDQIDLSCKADNIIVGFEQPIDESHLTAIESIESVEHQYNQHYLIRCRDRGVTTRKVMELAVEHNWSITEIKQQDYKLEAFFEQVLRHAEAG